MKTQKMIQALLVSVCAITLAFANWQAVFAQSAQPVSTTGWFSAIWGDGRPGSTDSASAFMLTDDNGQSFRVALDDRLAAPLGGIMAIDRQRLTVTGIRNAASAAADGAATITDIKSIAFDKSAKAAADINGLVSGARPFISIMCKFQDVAAEPKTLSYFQNMYSNVYPGLDNYWQQTSYNAVNLTGSSAIGWFTLPHPRSYYFDGANWSFDRSSADCTAAADPYINFAPFLGINLMFNDELDGYAWGGGHYLVLDGVSRVWGMSWEPPWGYSSITALTHEMGHAFGLPHSSGTYGQTYDNQWDVMSDGWTNCSLSTHPTYGCLGQQTIAYHKDKLGWIPAGRKYTASWNTNTTLTLEQLGVPQSSNYLMVKIPIAGSATHFYTVEVRRRTGYDVKLPGGQSVIIHDVDTTRSRPAYVIDTDGNGNTGDEGAMWKTGERFLDTANGISVRVVSATATGFVVSIQTPAILYSAPANDGWILESLSGSNLGGGFNSTNGTFILGDDAANRQYRSILHFDTSVLPDTAVITKAILKILKQGGVGSNPFTTHGALVADIRKPYFGTLPGLQAADFQAATDLAVAAPFGATATNNWYSANLSNSGAALINRTGTTQFRLRFGTKTNSNAIADYASFYSGENATITNRPFLVIRYYIP